MNSNLLAGDGADEHRAALRACRTCPASWSSCARRSRRRSAGPMSAPAKTLAEIDLTDLDNFADGFPHELFAIHRREAPVWWHEPTRAHARRRGLLVGRDVRRDARGAAAIPATYSSERGGDAPYGGTLLQDLPVAGVVLNMMDDPRHARIRRLVSTGLTPRMVARLEDELRRRTRALLARIESGGPFDFLVEVAAELPMQAICILLGVPEEDRHELFEAVEHSFDFRGGRDGVRRRPPEAAAAPGADVRVRRRADRREARAARPTTCCRSSCTRRWPTSIRRALRRRAVRLLLAAVRRRLGDDAQRDRRRPARADRAARAAAPRCARDPALLPGGDRGDAALDDAVAVEAPHRDAPRPSSAAARSSPATRCSFWEGSANRDERVFARADEFDVAPRPEPAPRLRPRRALLPRRQPGAPRDAGGLRGAAAGASRATSWPARSSGRAATATPASAICRWCCGVRDGVVDWRA